MPEWVRDWKKPGRTVTGLPLAQVASVYPSGSLRRSACPGTGLFFAVHQAVPALGEAQVLR
ncbi:hypothetical protein E5E91_15570 (plasmid) [Deinococcus radiodurans R1 = ATCC 13939 = DSM 20539]|uniref:Uncharacterized protein n=1 Tax=Deinococcus radiodurans (strain ATCC 13939 / DSM 20539 / JCM 16871 / CCUG 27074 / LMG 4051 / NBRC 15346 / NCIMB 9279 / VKM B-1422 / R1) TaxID=243230 RepID=Q9RZV5_DEIRA|nr:hypothetical protein DR_B0006 [Deinococcus radiodurans R1 = ATCC 13939 = DSM 20539]ANC73215.1 hypothetical protein A2G07_15290 [Deinococcus radiodurans R1 = ATCC 13939 = DSM 20539]QEM73332.1 hypothetical protein DXG80_16235 [Deinococcus radiodurans]UDL02142.1 hypothetical protein E5E91_15570 [Deinococcus radiodurans R1 = ATCC 13939 = DSM 20539]